MTQLVEVWSTRTSTRDRVADYIRVHQLVIGLPPTHREIGEALGITSLGTIAYHLEQLTAGGRLRPHPPREACGNRTAEPVPFAGVVS